MKYKTVPISEIIEEISMGPFGSNIKVECFVDKGIPVLNGSNVDGFKLCENEFRYVTKEKADSLGKANAFRGDIIITHRGTLGQIVYIPQNSHYDRFIISQSQFRVRCNTKKALPEYVVYYFHTREGQYQLLSNKSQVGVPALGRPTSTFQSLFIPLPTIDQQKEIIATLSCIDEKIELNAKINANLEAQAQSIFKSWFVDFEPFRDDEFVDSELGPIPKGWRVGTVADFALDMKNGGTPSRNNEEYWNSRDIPWIKTGEILNHPIVECEEYISKSGLNNSSARLLPINSVLIALYGATAAKLALLRFEAATNQACCAMICESDNSAIYLYHSLLHRQSYIKGLAIGSAQQNLGKETIATLPLLIPPEHIIKQLSYNSIYNAIENTSKQILALSSIRDAILPKLTNGDIEITMGA